MGLLLVASIKYARSGNRIVPAELPVGQRLHTREMAFRLSLLLSPKELEDLSIPLGVTEVRPFLAFKVGSLFQLTFVHVDDNSVCLSACLHGFPWNRDQSVTSPK